MTGVGKKAPAAKKAAPQVKATRVKAVELQDLLAIGERMDAGFQRVLDRLAGIQSVPAVELTAQESLSESVAIRHEVLLALITSKSAQQFLQDMLDTGAPPSLAQVNREIDRRLALR